MAMSLHPFSPSAQSLASAPVKRAVMEEFTGLGCGFCVRGIVGIKKCEDTFGDRFIAIARHTYSGTPDGMRVPSQLPGHGVYIVRLADGAKTAVRRVVY